MRPLFCSWALYIDAEGQLTVFSNMTFPSTLLKTHLSPFFLSGWFLWCHQCDVGGYLPALWLARVYHRPIAKLIKVLIAQILATSLIVTVWEWLTWCLTVQMSSESNRKFSSVAAWDTAKLVTMGWNDLGNALSVGYFRQVLCMSSSCSTPYEGKVIQGKHSSFLNTSHEKNKKSKLLWIS